MSKLTQHLQSALERRTPLFQQLQQENTDCYRLFHGSNEGYPGLTVDRYGPQLLIQSFHHSLDENEQDTISQVMNSHFAFEEIIYQDRSQKKQAFPKKHLAAEQIGHEMGVAYRVRGRHAGQDPLLFLDFRVARRWILQEAQGKSVLNLFAYTCGIGLCATLKGAREVWNVDFATRNLAVGKENLALNQLDADAMRFVQGDFFSTVRQLAGLPVSLRYQQQNVRQYERFEPKTFDIVCLDPPRWAKSPFGTVDLIRDYQSVLKPALLATAEGGQLLCSNNVAQVELEPWLELVLRCANKSGRSVKSYQVLQPEADFPSFDHKHPLKIAVLQL